MKPKIDGESEFKKLINKVIGEGKHVEYLEQVKVDYEKYKKFFENIFTDENSPDDIYTFRISYLLKKKVWREFESIGEASFDELAEEIIDSMKWENDHLHGFEIPDPAKRNQHRFCSPYTFYSEYWEDDPYPTFKSTQIRICDIDYKKVPVMFFIFDFGDGHLFKVEFKGKRKVKNTSRRHEFPVLIDQRGVAPEQYPLWEDEGKE